jgi:hypothetical protein
MTAVFLVLVKMPVPFVAAGEACVRLRSSREIIRRGVSGIPRIQVYDCYAAGRRLRQLLQGIAFEQQIPGSSLNSNLADRCNTAEVTNSRTVVLPPSIVYNRGDFLRDTCQ